MKIVVFAQHLRIKPDESGIFGANEESCLARLSNVGGLDVSLWLWLCMCAKWLKQNRLSMNENPATGTNMIRTHKHLQPETCRKRYSNVDLQHSSRK